jgi:hypothetical protein
MRQSKEFQKFNQAMETILQADPKAVKAAMEAEKKANAEKRKTKPSASSRASAGKD